MRPAASEPGGTSQFCNPAILQSCNSDFYLRRVLRRRDSLFDEGVPIVTVRALPQQLGAAIAAAQAHVWVEVEDGVPRQLAVAVDENRLVTELAERAPDRLMDAAGVRVLDERCEEQIQRVARPLAGREVPRQRESRAPVLGVLVDEALAEPREAVGRSRADGERFQAIERQIRAVRRDVAEFGPNRVRFLVLALCPAHVAQIQV